MTEQLRRLAREVHRRSLWQILTVYVVASWVVYDVVVNLVEGLALPDWVAPTALVLLLLGLPLVLATGFIQEGGPARSGGGARGSLPGREPESASAAADTAPSPDDVRQPESIETALSTPAKKRVFTWPRTVTAIVLAFAVLGVVATGFVGMRALAVGPFGTLIGRGELDAQARVLVADFQSPTADSLVAGAVAEALRIDLPQSPVLQVVERAEMGRTLRRMQRDPVAHLDEATARELAIREGIPAVLAGELTPVGEGYLISVRLLTPDSGRVLFRARETAEGAGDILGAVDQLSTRLRERAGESFGSLRETPPLRRVTTGSLEALQLYSAAVQANSSGTPGGYRKAARLLEAALERDSLFASAWCKLGTALINAGFDRERAYHAYSRAVELEDRLTEEERFWARAHYHTYVTGDRDRAIDAYERILARSPDYFGARNNLGLLHAATGDFDRAAAVMEQAVRADSTALSLGNLVAYRIAAGDTAGARAALALRRRLYPDNPTNGHWAARLAYSRGDVARAREIFDSLVHVVDPLLEPAVLEYLAALDLRKGQLEAGAQRMRRSTAIYEQQGRPAPAIFNQIQRASMDLFVRGRPDLAVPRVWAALEAARTRELPALQTAWLQPLGLLAVAGEVAEADSLLGEWRETVPEGLERRSANPVWAVEGAIALGRGRVEEGLELTRMATEQTGSPHYWTAILAVGYDAAGRQDSALAAYHRYERIPHWTRLSVDAIFLPIAYERMAQIHELRGEVPEAIHYYRAFLDLWEDADPELQPRVGSARRALARLVGEGRSGDRE